MYGINSIRMCSLINKDCAFYFCMYMPSQKGLLLT